MYFNEQGGATVTELEKYDLNGDGVLQPDERAIMLEDLRRKMLDDDAHRDQQRQMVWWVLAGMLTYPLFVVGADLLDLDKSQDILGSMATIYFPSTSIILGAFFGASAYQAKKGS
jgi:hypothetical protein